MSRSTNILSKRLCVDDFGNEVYVGHFTKRLVFCDGSDVRAGPVLYSVTGFYPEVPGYEPIRTQSTWDLQDFDQNCNFCRHLIREKSDAHGNRGKCAKPTSPAHVLGVTLRFHPEDPMFMECYESRRTTAKTTP